VKVLFFLLCVSFLYAQVSISGKVLEGKNPLAGVKVSLKGKSLEALTNEDGLYELKNDNGVSLLSKANQENSFTISLEQSAIVSVESVLPNGKIEILYARFFDAGILQLNPKELLGSQKTNRQQIIRIKVNGSLYRSLNLDDKVTFRNIGNLTDTDTLVFSKKDFKTQKFEVTNLTQVFADVIMSEQDRVANVTFEPSPGTYFGEQSIVLKSATEDAKIYYTLDGSYPYDSTAILYTESVTLSNSASVKVRSYKEGMKNSFAMTAAYTISTAKPEISPLPISGFDKAQEVTLLSAGATIYYTTDGSNPTENSNLYTGPIFVTSTQTIKALAVKEGIAPSSITEGYYLIYQDGDTLAGWLTETIFDNMTRGRNAFYTWDAFKAAYKSLMLFEDSVGLSDFKDLFREGSTDDKKREFAAFMAHVQQETGGSNGLQAIHEWCGGPSAYGACTSDYNNPASGYGNSSSEYYYGRGPLQLSHNTNYALLSKQIYNDYSVLINEPQLLENNAELAFLSAFWFWTAKLNSVTIHDMLVNKKQFQGFSGFAASIRAINGAIECGGYTAQAANRIKNYNNFQSKIGVAIQTSTPCY
jgi:hypothetical protein